MPTAEAPQIPGMAQFKIHTNALQVITKALPDGTSRKVLKGTASSSIKDHHGDEFTAECVQKMARSAKEKGMTIFLNHKYQVPEDVFGTTEDAVSVVRTEGLDTYTDLDVEIGLNATNERAVKTLEAIDEGGVKLGISIGCLIKQWHPRDPKDTWGFEGMIIDDVELLEASIVGIPANPRSWVQNAVKAVKSLAHEEDVSVTREADGTVEVVIKTADATPPPEPEPPAPQEPPAPEDDPEPAPESESQPPVPGAADEETKSSETPSDTPPSEGSLALTLSATPAAALDLLIDGYKAELTRKAAEITQLKAERDAALDGLKVATEIVARIASLPIGRKTAFANQVSSFREQLGGVYGEDFLKFLENPTP